jgi:signal transduction histidine kinase
MSPGKHQLAGEPKRLIGVSMDITDRKHSEEAFRVSEARLAAGTDLAGLGYYEVEYGQRNCFIDDRFRDICGVPPGLQGLQSLEFWMEHVHPDDRQFLLDERQKLHDGRLDRISAEYRYLHPAHGQKWIHHLARIAARSTTGQGVHTFGVVRDITQQKRAELEAQELRNNLAHLARVNTLGALSGSLAHESNQPLGIILSNAQAAQELLLQEPPDLAEVQAILSDIVAADRRAGEVIERLRAMLKHGQVSLQPVVLNQVIEEVLHLTRADLIGRGITVVRQLAPDLPPIAGDRVQLQQLVLNLILNAAEAMTANAPGARRLHLQTMLHQGRVRASVRGMRAAGCRRTWSASSSRSTRPSPRVWAWAWPSAGPLWPLTPAGFGPNLTPSAAPFSNSNCRCRKGQVARAKWQVTDQSNRVPNFTRHQPLATSHRPLLMGGNL